MATGLQPKHLRKGSLAATHLQADLAIIAIKLSSLTPSIPQIVLNSANSQAIGIAGEYLDDPSKPLALCGLAFATRSLVLVIEIDHQSPRRKSASEAGNIDADSEDELEHDDDDPSNISIKSLRSILENPERIFLAFNADRLALALHSSLNQTVNNLVDLQSAVPEAERHPRNAPMTFYTLLGGIENVHPLHLQSLFASEVQKKWSPHNLAFRAWTAFVAQHFNDLDANMMNLPKIDTVSLRPQLLNVVTKIFGDGTQLESLKPNSMEIRVGRELEVEEGSILALPKQDRGKFWIGSQQEVFVKVKDKRYPYKATIQLSKDKPPKLYITAPLSCRTLDVVSLLLVGPEDPAYVDTIRSEIILKVLSGRNAIFGNVLPKCLWFEQVPGKVLPPHPEFLDEFAFGMNDRQRDALKLMMSESEDIQLPMIIGPPGTGKTTVISAFTRALAASQCHVWVVAHSNVGVKNIASRLMRDNFDDWRLLISKDFYRGGNEGLYRDIPGRNKIISDDFKNTSDLGGARIILCTLNLLVNRRLGNAHYLDTVPLRILVVDEASQIELGSYLPILAKHENIQKICFFGDDKQLAPFGAEKISDLGSVFEVPHLRSSAVFLDTQYRVPVAIAEFISREMYGSELQSRHSNTSRSSCRFIDIAEGEEEKFASSFRNVLEVRAVKNLVKIAADMNLDFRVITPYEGQRANIEAMLRKSDLPFQDRVFNVDSFQGNEADIIIISLVRTKKIGFLTNLRRINVMLTRCKVAMFICCNMEFLQTTAADTLVGKMISEWKEAGETIMDPRSQNVSWQALFKNLKLNTLHRATVPVTKKSHKSRKLDLTKLGYGTVIKAKSTSSKRVNGNKANAKSPQERTTHPNGSVKINGVNKTLGQVDDIDDWGKLGWWEKDLEDDDEKWEQNEEWIPDGW